MKIRVFNEKTSKAYDIFNVAMVDLVSYPNKITFTDMKINENSVSIYRIDKTLEYYESILYVNE